MVLAVICSLEGFYIPTCNLIATLPFSLQWLPNQYDCVTVENTEK